MKESGLIRNRKGEEKNKSVTLMLKKIKNHIGRGGRENKFVYDGDLLVYLI